MRVVFVQKFVPHYRLPFFKALRGRMNNSGDELQLVYGPPDPFEGSKVKTVDPEWGSRCNTKHIKIGRRYLYWQGVIFKLKRNDVVVVEHAAKLLDNYFIYFLSRIGFIKMAYFGHGENFQSRFELPLSRWLKKRMLSKVARWFAYTDVSKQSLLGQGVDPEIITVVNNTLQRPDVSLKEGQKVKNRFIYIGGLYVDKRIEVLLEASQIVANQVSDFELHIVGDGPLRHLIEKRLAEIAQNERQWLHYHGHLYGDNRNQLLATSQAILMPGLVGLVAIDSFFFASPIITSTAGQHSPEIAYLEANQNMLLDTGETVQSYADTILLFLGSPELAADLQKACIESADYYTIDSMADRFHSGIEALK